MVVCFVSGKISSHTHMVVASTHTSKTCTTLNVFWMNSNEDGKIGMNYKKNDESIMKSEGQCYNT